MLLGYPYDIPLLLILPWLVPSSGVAGIADDLIPPCCPVCCVVLFQTHLCRHLYGILWPSISFGVDVLGVYFLADSCQQTQCSARFSLACRRPLYHFLNTCLRIISIVLSFYNVRATSDCIFASHPHLPLHLGVFTIQCQAIFLSGKHHAST